MYLALLLGVSSMAFRAMAYSWRGRDERRSARMKALASGSWGKREEFTTKGWRWRNVAVVCQLAAIGSLILAFLTG